MLLIRRLETDPYFNLAAEEYILKNLPGDIFMAWRNDPCIIIGKHQNAAREVNHRLAQKLRLPVIRRISGGGTVYHDPGNINFSFIFADRKVNPIDFKVFTRPVIEFLGTIGIKARLEGKNSIYAGGFKISGNAAHVDRDRVLYHGTLLINADLDALTRVVQGDEMAYADRAVRSVPATVNNIAAILGKKLDVPRLIDGMYRFIGSKWQESSIVGLYPEQRSEITELAAKKYRTHEWNYGYSPAYLFSRKFDISGSAVEINLRVSSGIIDQADISGEQVSMSLRKWLKKSVEGKPHEINSLTVNQEEFNFTSISERELLNQIIAHMF
jgi:lipoate-protein ligase A